MTGLIILELDFQSFDKQTFFPLREMEFKIKSYFDFDDSHTSNLTLTDLIYTCIRREPPTCNILIL